MPVMGIPDLRIDPSEALDLRGEMVDVIVGPESPQRFTIHEGLLRSNLEEYTFKRLLKEEDGHKCIILDDHSPESFKVYATWLYRRRLPIPVENDTDSDEEEVIQEEEEVIQDEYIELAKAYNLGCKLKDIDFTDAVIDAFMVRAFTKDSKGQNLAPGYEAVNLIHDTYANRTKRENVLIDLYMRFGNPELWCGELERYCELFVQELAEQLLEYWRKGKNGDDILKDTCKYHCHDEGDCYRNRLTPVFMEGNQEKDQEVEDED